MLKVGLRLLLTLCITCILSATAFATPERETPLPTDTRIKTFLYNPNEIYTVKFVVGYQSLIELQEGEVVKLIAFGDHGPWKVTNLDYNLHKLFIKATDPGAKTNMIILTNKRTYSLEIESVSDSGDADDKITYVLRFFYPDINVDVPPTTTKLAKIALNKQVALGGHMNSFVNEKMMASAGSINTNYTYSGDGKNIVPTMVFDNGTKTYFKFTDMENLPIISAVNEKTKEIPLRLRKSGEYIYVDTVEQQFTIRKGRELICIFNEAEEKEVAYLNKKK